MAPARRPVRLLLVLALAGGLLGCSGGDGDDSSPTSDPAADRPEDRSPAALCTSVLNQRDLAVSQAGSAASLNVVSWAQQGETPDDADVMTAVAAMQAQRQALAADRETLDRAEVDDAALWEDVLAGLDQQIAVLDERIEVAAADDWESAIDRLELGAPVPEEVAEAVEEMGFVGRDCEVLAGYEGAPAEAADFVAEAAIVCRTIVERRAEEGYQDQADISLTAVVSVVEETDVVVDDALTDAVDALVEEWEATHDDLAALAASDAPDPAGWEQVVALAEQRVEAHTQRAAALAGGDQAELAEVFTPGFLGDPGFEGFELNGLAQRDCRSIVP